MTAVEWLFIQLYEKFEMKGDGREMDKILEQAKAMEEKQHNLIYKRGYVNGVGETQLTNSVMKNK